MNGRHERMDQYLINLQRLFQALKDNDLEAVNQSLDKNMAIMRDYDRAEFTGVGSRTNISLRAKMEAVLQANQQCLLYTEKRCRDLRYEIESTDKYRSGIIKYGATPTEAPRFIDRKT